jgi:hypothetical protein
MYRQAHRQSRQHCGQHQLPRSLARGRLIGRVAGTVDNIDFPDLRLLGSTLRCGWMTGPTVNNTIIAMIMSNMTIALAQVALDALARAFSKGPACRTQGLSLHGSRGSSCKPTSMPPSDCHTLLSQSLQK